MSALPKRKNLTVDEYLAIERAAESKSEFFDGELFAMAGASHKHNEVNENLSIELGLRLRGSGCRSLSRDMRVRTDRSGLYCYPDLIIVCGKPEFADALDDILTNPTVIVEVLSPSTANYDRGTKFRLYQKIESLKEYILVAQDEAVIERFVRQADESWALVSFVGLDAVLPLISVPVRIPLADIYAGVEFEEANPTEGGRR